MHECLTTDSNCAHPVSVSKENPNHLWSIGSSIVGLDDVTRQQGLACARQHWYLYAVASRSYCYVTVRALIGNLAVTVPSKCRQ